jgi:hypothetical protein
MNRRDGNGDRNGNCNGDRRQQQRMPGCAGRYRWRTGSETRCAGIVWVMIKSGGRTAALPWHLARGFLLLGLFGADFAEEFFAAKFAFFLDDDFAKVGPGGF